MMFNYDRFNGRLREKLASLCKDTSVAEVADQLGTSRSNISHYLKGRKIPADVCGALIDQMGVDPNWLMQEESVAQPVGQANMTSYLARDLLEILETGPDSSGIKKAKERDGKSKTQKISIIHEAARYITSQQSTAKKVRSLVEPAFEYCIDQLDKMLREGNFLEAGLMISALEQVEHLCSDADIHQTFLMKRAAFHFLQYDVSAAIPFWRKRYSEVICSEIIDVALLMRLSSNIWSAYVTMGRYSDAKKIIESTLPHTPEGSAEYIRLIACRAWAVAELGDIDEGVVAACRSFLMDPKFTTEENAAHLLTPLLFSGIVPLKSAGSIGGGLGQPRMTVLMEAACCLEDTFEVKRLYKVLGKNNPTQSLETGLVHPKLLLKAVSEGARPSVSKIKEILIQHLDERTFLPAAIQCHLHIALVQALRIAKHKAEAVKICRECNEMIIKLPDSTSISVWYRGLHSKNILVLSKNRSGAKPLSHLVSDAKTFFSTYIGKGYHSLQLMLD